MKLSFEMLSKPQMTARLPWLQSHQEESESTGIVWWLRQLRQSQAELEKQHRELQEARQHLEKARDRYAEFYDSVPVGYVTLDEAGRVLEINPAAAALLSRECSALVGKHFIAWLANGNSRIFFDHLRQVFSCHDKAVCNLRVRDPGGVLLTVRLESVVVEDAETGPICQTLMTDATGHNKTEQLLSLATRGIANTSEGVMISDERGVIISVNPAFETVTGYTAREAVGSTAELLRSDRHDENFYRQMLSALHDNGQWQGEVWNRRKNGELCLNWLSISAVKDKQGKVTHYVSIYSDSPDEEYLLDRLHYFAFYDTVTGLPNRRLFMDRLQLAVAHARRDIQPLAVMFIDLDNFKQINDTLGHKAGDELLKVVAEKLRGCLREGDTLARLGGDEFTALLPAFAQAEDAANVARKFLECFATPIKLDGHELHVTGSIGISLFPDDSDEPDHLLNKADMAMYRAKESGRNGYHFSGSVASY